YNPKQGGLAESLEVGLTMAQHSECFARMRDQFADAGFPNLIYSLSDRSLQRRAATLNIRKPQRGRDEGVFVCHIVSCFDHAVAKKRVTRRDFAFKKDQPPNTQEVALGQPIFVSCAVSDTGLSSPQLVWYEGNSMKEESRVPMYNASGPARVSQFPNATLRISAVSLDDRSFLCAGFYRSVARSTTFNPVIRLPARVLPFDGEPRLEVTAGSTVSIPCRAKGELPMTFQWFAAYQAGGHSLCRVDGDCRQVGIYTEDQDLGNGNSGFGASIGLSGFGSQTLELRRANAGLSGRYTCRASNQYNIFNSRGTGGYSERSIDIVVVSPPGPVRSFQPTDAGADWATLQWEPPPRNGHKPVTAYKVVYTDESASDPGFSIASQETVAATTAGDARSLTVRGLRPGRQLVFRISAVNSVGEGPAVSARVATLEKPPAGPVRNLRVSATPVELSPIEDAQSRDGGVKLVLNWDPPDAQLMNGRLTNYTVHYRRLELGELPADCPPGLAGDSGGGSSTSRFLLATKTPALTAVIGGGFGRDRLRTMSDYQLRVIPANAVGEGPPACAVARTLGSAPMSPPSEVRCQAEGEDRVRVTWTEPPQKSLNGRLVAYQLQYMQAADLVGQDESSAVEVEISGQQRHHVILGLSPFTNYSVSVSVSNSKGRSPLSRPAAFCRTHSSAPIPPADIRPFGANSSAVALAWRQTDRPNGELLRYDLQARCDGGLSDAGNFSKLMPVAPPHRTMVLINGIQVGALCRFRPLRVASLPSASRVARGSSLTLDCSIVGDGSHEAQWQGPPVDSSKKQVLSNGSLLIESAQSSGQYSCVTADSSDHISHSVEVFTTPSPPQLLPGRVTLTSLEILWRLSGTQAGPAASVATREGARLTELELRYTNLHNGETESRTLDLHPGNRSHLLDPVACGSAVEFRARVVNAFGLRSAFAGPLRMRAPGAAPSPAVSAVTGSGLVVRETALGDVVLNLTAAFLPGLGCPAERFFVYATGRSSDASIVAAVFDGDNGSGSSLRLTAGRLLLGSDYASWRATRQEIPLRRALLDVALPPAPPPVAAWPSSGDGGSGGDVGTNGKIPKAFLIICAVAVVAAVFAVVIGIVFARRSFFGCVDRSPKPGVTASTNSGERGVERGVGGRQQLGTRRSGRRFRWL
uniref:Down syndrome cell adhesion molecule-like protein Dscam2 n=1 Tax=Macrostomum lignano TaxID=282301 RepID=A0A1I8ISP6_9PLAT